VRFSDGLRILCRRGPSLSSRPQASGREISAQLGRTQVPGLSLHPATPCGSFRALRAGRCLVPRCRSSVVEHSLGKGEVHSSILCGSTSKINGLAKFRFWRATVCATAMRANKSRLAALATSPAGCHFKRALSIRRCRHGRDVEGCARDRRGRRFGS
jgi:hypothetical protein